MMETLAFTRKQLLPNEQFLDALRCTYIDESEKEPTFINGLLIATNMRVLFISEKETIDILLELSYDDILHVKKGSLLSNPSLLFTTTSAIYHFIQIISTNLEYFLQMIRDRHN